MLTLSLLSPALLGYLLILILEKPRAAGNVGSEATAVGYGILLGYALAAASLWAMSKATGHFHAHVMLAASNLTAITFIALIVAGKTLGSPAKRSTQSASNSVKNPSRSVLESVIIWALLMLVALHLIMVAIEILWRPVFPWDAWLNWIYRAKVWFYNDSMLPFSEPAAWENGTRSTLYNVAGAHYPPLLPLVTVWAATALGSWSETLINLPTLMLGIGLSLAIYGQCRRAGLGTILALAPVVATLSTPILGAHLALAGQADAWMTGFAGLGLVAVLHGILERESRTMILGLTFCLIGTAVKLEGWLWLALAALLVALRSHIHTTAIVSVSGFLSLAVFARWMPTQWIDSVITSLPLPASLGGIEALNRELADDYVTNYLLGGSWHLGGWILCASMIWAIWHLRNRSDREAMLLVSFTAMQGSVLLIVFNFSQHGAWAEDWTAINRLPLHLLPAHCYLWARIARRVLAASQPVSSKDWWVPAISTVILAAAFAGFLLKASVNESGAPAPRVFQGKDLRMMVGRANTSKTRLEISGYRNEIAVASSGPVYLNTDALPLVILDLSAAREHKATFFWRRKDDHELYSTVIEDNGNVMVDLRRLDNGQGVIEEFGILAYRDTTDTPFAIKKIQYVPLNPLTVLNKIRYDWSKTSRWALSSVNWVPAGENKPVLALPLAAAFITGVVALVTFGLGRGKTAGRILVPTIAVMWLCLELRWVSNLVVQAQDTVTSYSFIESTAHQLDYDSRVRDTVEQVLATEGTIDPATSTKRTILITAERLDLRYRMLRAKYHAAPSPALVLVNWSEQAARAGDELLMLPAAYAGDVERERDLQDFSSLLGQAGLALGKVERISGSAFAHVVPAADNARIGDSAASRIQK